MYLQVLIPITPSVKKFVDLVHEFKYIYKPRYTNVLVSVDHNSMAAHLTRCDCEGFYISSGMDEPDDETLWNGSEEDGNVKC
jgi:hypothetical protein